MFLNRNNIHKIQDILERFPEVETFEIRQDNSSGIGNITTMSFNTKINDVVGSFNTVIAGVEDW